MTVWRFIGRRSAETPFLKRALMKRELLEHNNYFKVLHGLPQTSVESSSHEAFAVARKQHL